MLIDKIKKANMEALKSKDTEARAIYSVVMNKYMLAAIDKREKNLEITDADLIQIIMKTLKELSDEKESFQKVGKFERVTALTHQEEVIKQYLPKMLSEEEIRAEIEKLADKSIPSIMKHFKANFQGQVDMSLVSKIAKGL
jgi:hypothetical protein